MKGPEEFLQNLEINQLTSDNPGLIEGGSEAPDIEEGGVNLLDGDDEHQQRGIQPLQAEVNLIEMNERPQLTRSNLEKWPRLPDQKPTQLTESLRKLSISSSITETGSGGASIHGSQMSASEFASQITSRRGGNKVYTESLISLNSPKNVASSEVDDTASEASTTRASSANGSAAWTAGSTSQVLFKGAKPTPPRADWDVVLKRRAEEARAHPTTNLFHSRFWDPTSNEFDIRMFWNGVIGKYHCPFDGCQDAVYDVDVDLIGHLQHAHLKKSYRCPLCLKLFNSASALIGHSESNGKCKVKKSSVYQKLLDEVSGGFLKAEYLQEPKIAKGQNGTLANGIMSTKFTAKMPDER